MTPSNDDTFAPDQALNVALHARYLLALKGHRRGAFILGFFYGVMVSVICWYLWPKVARLLS